MDDVVAFTGHRPERLGPRLEYASRAIRAFLEETRPKRVISGFAQGVDMLAFNHAVDLKIPATAAIPWWGHGKNWADTHRDEYLRNLDLADDVVVVCDTETYGPWVYQKRDEWMVDNSTTLAAVFDGIPHGGTYNTIEYAYKVGRVIRYLQWR